MRICVILTVVATWLGGPLVLGGCPSPTASQPRGRSPQYGEPASPMVSATALTPGDASSAWEIALPAQGGRGKVQDLVVTVIEVVEKRTMDGNGMMRATLRLRANGKDENVEITSDQPKLEWNGYELQYLGGWREEVKLKIHRLSR